MTNYMGNAIAAPVGPIRGANVIATLYQGVAFDSFDGGHPSIIGVPSGSYLNVAERAPVNAPGILVDSISEKIYNYVSTIPSSLNVAYEYHIYQPRVIDGRDGKKHLGHYSNIPGLLEGITNLILKHRSTAQSFEELEQNLISIRGLIESIQQTIKEAE